MGATAQRGKPKREAGGLGERVPLCFLMAPSSEALKELSDSSSPSGSCKAGPLHGAAGGSFSRSQESRSSSLGLGAGRAWAGSSSGGEVEEAAAAS